MEQQCDVNAIGLTLQHAILVQHAVQHAVQCAGAEPVFQRRANRKQDPGSLQSPITPETGPRFLQRAVRLRREGTCAKIESFAPQCKLRTYVTLGASSCVVHLCTG